jgi:hypothetical protein
MLRKLLTLVLVVVSCASARAQYTVKVIVDAIPPKHPDDALYLMGDYNQWSPNDPNYQFTKDSSGKYVLVGDNVPANSYEVKITRGTALTVECAADGKPIEGRKWTINSDTTFHVTIAGWADDFAKPTGYLNRKVVPSIAK